MHGLHDERGVEFVPLDRLLDLFFAVLEKYVRPVAELTI